VRVLAGSVRAWERTCEYERALALAREAVEVAVDAKVDAEIGPAHYMLGRILLATGAVDTAIDELERAAAAAEQTLNPVLLAISLLERGDALARLGRLAEAVPAALARPSGSGRGDTEPHAPSRPQPRGPAPPARPAPPKARGRGAHPRRARP
jgi:hypothetical protein